MVCEKCWADAAVRSAGSDKTQYECYLELLEERKETPCHLDEQSAKEEGS